METLHDIRIRKISKIFPHPNADKLEILQIDGWQTIASINSFKVNEDCIYVPIDFILPEILEKKVFGDSKITRSGSGRIRSIKLRGSLSQGLAISFSVIKEVYNLRDQDIESLNKKNMDWGIYLNILKYEPPEKDQGQPTTRSTQPAKKKFQNINFKKYTKVPKYQDIINYFDDECEVCITEKIHGSNARFSYIRSEAKTLWQKIKKLFGFLPEWQFVFGSHEVQLSNKLLTQDTNNVFAIIAKRLDLQNRLPKDIIIFGEIYGHKIQKNYEYGLKDSQDFILFDAYIPSTKRWLNCFELIELNKTLNLQMVPILYKGKFDPEKVEKLASGPSVLYPAQSIREGIVIEKISDNGERNKIRLINNNYLLKSDTTDFH